MQYENLIIICANLVTLNANLVILYVNFVTIYANSVIIYVNLATMYVNVEGIQLWYANIVLLPFSANSVSCSPPVRRRRTGSWSSQSQSAGLPGRTAAPWSGRSSTSSGWREAAWWTPHDRWSSWGGKAEEQEEICVKWSFGYQEFEEVADP